MSNTEMREVRAMFALGCVWVFGVTVLLTCFSVTYDAWSARIAESIVLVMRYDQEYRSEHDVRIVGTRPLVTSTGDTLSAWYNLVYAMINLAAGALTFTAVISAMAWLDWSVNQGRFRRWLVSEIIFISQIPAESWPRRMSPDSDVSGTYRLCRNPNAKYQFVIADVAWCWTNGLSCVVVFHFSDEVKRFQEALEAWKARHYPHFLLIASAPLMQRISLLSPRQIVIQPGSPSPLRPKKPPSIARDRKNSRTVLIR